MTFIRGLLGTVNTSPNIIVGTNTDLANVVINDYIHPGTLAIVGNTNQFIWDPLNTSPPSSTIVQPNDGSPGRWVIVSFSNSLTSGAVVFDGGSTTNNLRGARASNQSPINNSQNGIVNLGSKTTGTAVGAVGAYSTISGGDQATASGNYSTVAGGLQNTASNLGAAIGGGSLNAASGQYSFAVGNNNTASGNGSFVSGINAIAQFTGAASQASGMFAAPGDAQTQVLTAFGIVTNSLTEIFINNISERIILPANSVYGFKICIAVYASVSLASGYWEFSGAIKSDGSATVSFVGNAVDKMAIVDDTTWDADVNATASSLRIRAKGAVSPNVNRAVARIELTQLKF